MTGRDLRIVERPPNTELIEDLEMLLGMARKGEIEDFVCAASTNTDSDGPGYLRIANFKDRWRVIGALEYAKEAVHRG